MSNHSGLKPLATLKQLNIIPQRFRSFTARPYRCGSQNKDNEAISNIGVEWCIQQSKIKNTVSHFYIIIVWVNQKK